MGKGDIQETRVALGCNGTNKLTQKEMGEDSYMEKLKEPLCDMCGFPQWGRNSNCRSPHHKGNPV